MTTAFFISIVKYVSALCIKNKITKVSAIPCTELLNLLQLQSSHLYFPLSIFAMPGSSYDGA